MTNPITTLSRERLVQLADENTICKVSWDERIEIARALLAVMDAKPFMYAIADNEGKAHFDEICVDADGGLLNDVVDALNIDAEPSDTGYSVVPVYTTPPAPSAPDGWATLPAKLSADNGAKAALSGEFLEVKFISCPECFGDDDCDSCDGSGRVKVEIPVSWTTIKAIWEKGVQHFSAVPAPGVE